MYAWYCWLLYRQSSSCCLSDAPLHGNVASLLMLCHNHVMTLENLKICTFKEKHSLATTERSHDVKNQKCFPLVNCAVYFSGTLFLFLTKWITCILYLHSHRDVSEHHRGEGGAEERNRTYSPQRVLSLSITLTYSIKFVHWSKQTLWTFNKTIQIHW